MRSIPTRRDRAPAAQSSHRSGAAIAELNESFGAHGDLQSGQENVFFREGEDPV